MQKSLYEHFDQSFTAVFSRTKNTDYIHAVQQAFLKKSWTRFTKLLWNAIKTLKGRIEITWESDLKQFENALQSTQPVIFKHQEGVLTKALKYGHWILLDEINLASPETLDVLNSLLREDTTKHIDFRLFAAMNPATDINKRELPQSVRTMFTEFFVDAVDNDRQDLFALVQRWEWAPAACEAIVDLYCGLKTDTELVDTNSRRPLLNLRTLTRALNYAKQAESLFGLDRALYEGFSMAVSTVLDKPSKERFRKLALEALQIHTLKDLPSTVTDKFVVIDGYVLARGPITPFISTSFVMTPSAKENVKLLARAVHYGHSPILLEGPTSAGKTSLVEYLARATGHNFLRINNHEHTDLQEYLGMYVSEPETGQLVFKEGALVQALRKGDWVVLDELNLAPSDVLEALNRLLDDNRELYIPETDSVVRPHPSFMLFATQNPAGTVYGGRKPLSRAFRSRFIEIAIDDIPSAEVDTILEHRCHLAPSQAKKMSKVYLALQERRQAVGNVFAGKHSLITLRDLFRWATREHVTSEDLALNGYKVLAERLRNEEDKQFIKQIIEDCFRCTLDVDYSNVGVPDSSSIVWTGSMKRLYHLVTECIKNREPVLLVGETGCGKTTICQVISHMQQQCLIIVNCHQNTEASDLLGSYRPCRDGKRVVCLELMVHS